MKKVTYPNLDALRNEASQIELSASVRPFNSYDINVDTYTSITYVHADTRISWRLWIHTEDEVLSLEVLGDNLLAGGYGEYGILRFPDHFAWASQKEALGFWTRILPVRPHKILFTFMELHCVYVQLDNGMIGRFDLQWNRNDIEEVEFVKTIFLLIIESTKTTPLP